MLKSLEIQEQSRYSIPDGLSRSFQSAWHTSRIDASERPLSAAFDALQGAAQWMRDNPEIVKAWLDK